MKIRVLDRILVAIAGVVLLAICAGLVAQVFSILMLSALSVNRSTWIPGCSGSLPQQSQSCCS